MTKVLFWGSFDPHYPTNRHLIQGLEHLQSEGKIRYDVINKAILDKKQDNSKLGMITLLRTFIKVVLGYLRLWPRLIANLINFRPQYVIIGYFGYIDILTHGLFFKLLGKKIIFIPLVSLHNTLVEDRKLINSKLFSAFVFQLDKFCFALADKIVMDTQAHADYLISKYHLNSNKFSAVYISEIPLIAPEDKLSNSTKFRMLFIGKHIPFYGLDNFIEALQIIKTNDVHAYANMEVLVVGKGQNRTQIEQLVNNHELDIVSFRDWINCNDEKEYVTNFDLGIGILKDSDKGRMVIPNKLYLYCAISLPALTLRTPAVQEVFEHNKNIIMADDVSPRAIATQLIELAKDKRALHNISQNCYSLLLNEFQISSYYGKSFQTLFHELNALI
jgi:glycosyltransferase involved in cell wall biosynthesis